jgi:hypothetical protein
MSSGPPGSNRPRPGWQSSGPRVMVDRPQGIAYLSPQASKPQPERTQAMIVMALTLACTVLSIYDLFLLASGVR